METAKTENKEQLLRDLARDILGTLEKAYVGMQTLSGVQLMEAQKDVDVNGTIDELSMLLTDIKCSVNNLVSLIDRVNQRV